MLSWRFVLASSKSPTRAGRLCVQGTRNLLTSVFKLSMETSNTIQLGNTSGVLSVSNIEPLVDEIIKIKTKGLVPGEQVTLRVETSVGSQNKVHFQSFGHFQADENGTIDLSSHSPVNGTYSGIDPMGLFWSLDEVDGQRPGSRIFQRDARKPVEMNLEFYNGFVDFNVPIDSISEVVKNSSLVEKIELKRWYLSKDVERQEVRSGRLRGTVFVPKNHDGKMPGIIDMFGTAGGLADFRAALLASHGFVTYALPFFDYDDLPKSLEDIDAEYFDEAVDWLSQHPKVKPGSIGMIGSSKGGELSLLTATRKHEVKAVVGLASPYFYIISSVMIGGKRSGCVPCTLAHLKSTPEGFVSTLHSWVDPYDDPNSDATIPVENMIADVLLMSGDDDQNMEATKYGKVIKERLERHGKGHQCTTVVYPEAGHLIEPPYMPLCTRSYHKAIGVILFWGGQKVLHAHAQKDSWERTIAFFKEKL